LGAKLKLDSKLGIHAGGESGKVFVAGKPDESLLVQALRYDGSEMPPEEPLPETVVNDFAEWIKRGAPYPAEKVVTAPNTAEPSEPKLWSLLPVENPIVPEVKNTGWSQTPIDAFILAKLEQADLSPTADATPRVLVRRLYYDLIGLPPTAADVDAFCLAYEQDQQSSVETLVDDLLSRSQYGERWGRHWLDVARYAESNGNDGLSRNPTFPHAWRYRDYVIEAFNNDVPYDQFLKEQIAGDLLTSDSPEEADRLLIATGFLALASKPAKAMNTNFEMDVVADQIDVIGSGVMGLSVACARCHDHKFDPISIKDYYALAGIFTSSETMWGVAGNEKLTAPPTDLHRLKTYPIVLPPEDFVETVILTESDTGKPKAIPKPKWEVGAPLAMGVRDKKAPADCKLNINGDSKKLGDPIPRGFLSACNTNVTETIAVDPKQSGRLQLAEWLTHKQHPLTARVMVNRVWMHLFGRGLVNTPNDFGLYGAKPTHPELLDHLATRFVNEGWSIKQLIRSIVLTRTYQLSSGAEAIAIEKDEQNLLVGRHERRRLDAESLRDSILQVSGQLNLEPGEGSIIRHRDILVNKAGNLHQPSNHRSIYLCYLRSSMPPSLAAFDLPEFTMVVGRREDSSIPGQALYLFNSPFVLEQAYQFGTSSLNDATTDKERVRFVYQRALNREPSERELQEALELVNFTGAESDGWTSLCQALFISNEFRYID